MLRLFYGWVGSWPWSLALLGLAVEIASLFLLAIAPGRRLMDRRREDEESLAARRPFLSSEEYERHKAAIEAASKGKSWQIAVTMTLFFATKVLPLYAYAALFLILRYAPDLRGARLFWIPDLTQPDPLYVVSLLLVLVSIVGVVRRLAAKDAQGTPGKLIGSVAVALAAAGITALLPAGLTVYAVLRSIAESLTPVLLAVVGAPLFFLWRKLK